MTERRRDPEPPRPDLVRRPGGAFGWLDARLLHEGWLGRLTPEATTVLVLLALAADRRGASYYGRERMAALVGLDRRQVDQALDLLRALGLVDHRPWRPGHPDGVWQLLPLPPAPRETRGGEPTSLGSILAALARDPGPGEPPRT